MTKLETALRVMAGTTSARGEWSVFFDDPPPEYERHASEETLAHYQDRINILVRNKACEWLAEQLAPLSSDQDFDTIG